MMETILSKKHVTLLCAVMIYSFFCTKIENQLLAQPTDTDSKIKIRKIFVPQGNEKQWPKGNWVPIERKRLQKFLDEASDNQPNKQPSKICLNETLYELNVNKKNELEGTFRSSIQSTTIEQDKETFEILNLTKTNLNFFDLESEVQTIKKRNPILWGTAPSGENFALIPKNTFRIHGRISGYGNDFGDVLEFKLLLPKSQRSNILLSLPTSWDIEISNGRVLSSKISSDQKQKVWSIQLGTSSELLLQILKSNQASKSKTTLLCSENSSWSIAQNNALLQSEYQFEVLGKPVNQFSWDIPSELSIDSVTLGGDLPVKFQTRQRGTRKILVVRLPEPISGKGRSLFVRGSFKPEYDTDWTIPALRTRNAVITKSATGIRINHPLDIQKYQARGYQQTAVKFDSGNSQLFRFEKLLPDGKLVFNISQPSSELFSRSLIRHELREKKWKSTTKIFLGARRGQQNIIRLEIPAGWEVRRVSADSVSSLESDLNGWRIRRVKEKRILEIQLLNPVSPASSKFLTITGAYPKTNFSKRKINFVTKVTDCNDQDIILEFLNSYNWKVTPASARNSKFVSAYSNKTTPVSWGESNPLEEGFEFPKDSRIWRMTENSNKTILFEVNSENIDARNQVNMRYFVKDAYLFCQSDLQFDTETIKKEFQDNNEPYKLMVYFTHSPKLPKWNLHSNSEATLPFTISTTLVEASKHKDFNLPENGSLWEVSISRNDSNTSTSPADTVPNSIHIRWARPLVDQISIPLCFVIGNEFSTGRIRINYDEGKKVEITTSEPILKLPETNDETRNYIFRYENPTDSISISTASDTRPVSTIAQPELTVDVKTPKDTRRRTEYRLLYQWQSPVLSKQIRISLSEETKLVALRVNGIPAKVRVSSSQLLLPETEMNQIESIELLATSPQQEDLLSVQNSLILPEMNVQPKSFRWEVEDVSDNEIFWNQHPVTSTFARDISHAFLGPWINVKNTRPNNSEFKFESITSPSRLSFSVVRTEMIQKLSWILSGSILCLTLFLKSIHKVSGRKLAFFLMPISLALFGFVSSQYLVFLGAVFSASLISLLLPIEFIKSIWHVELIRKAKAKASIPKWLRKGSIRTNTLGFILILFSQNVTFAQSEPVVVDNQFDVLIPSKLNARIPSESDLYYVDSKLHKKILEKEANKKSNDRFIIRNAKYELLLDEENSPKVVSTYSLSTLQNVTGPIEIILPYSGVTFDGINSCKVDGQVADMIPLSDSEGVLIKIEPTEKKSRTINNSKVEVTFYPELKTTGDIQFIETNIPKVISSYTTIQRPDEFGSVSVIRANGESIQIASNSLNPIWIGDSNRLKVLWSKKTASTISTTILKADLLAFVNVQPNLLRARFRANYSIESGQTQKVSWRLPSKSLVRSVKCEFLKSYSSITQRNGLTRLDIELNRPVDESFQVEADIDLPIRFLDKTVRIPAFDLFGSTGNSARIDTGQLFIGFSSLDGFKTKFEGGRADLFSLVTTEKYQEQWGTDPPAVSPGSVFQLASPVEFVAQLTPRQPRIKLDATQTLEVHPTETVLKANAIVLPTEIPVYRYVIDCDPKFVLDSISVRQDGVERLSQWRRLGNELQLFLNGPSLSEQEIKIVGRLELPISEKTSVVPLIFFPQSNSLSRNRLEIINLTTQVGTQISNAQGMSIIQTQSNVDDPENPTSNDLTSNIGSISRETSNPNQREFDIQKRDASFELKLFPIVAEKEATPSIEKENKNDVAIPAEFLFEDVYFKAPLILHRIMKRSESTLVGETAVWIRKIDSKFLYWNHLPGMTLLNSRVNGELLGEIYQSDTKWILPIQPAEDVCAITVNWKLDLEKSEAAVPLPEPRLKEDSIRFVMLNSMSHNLRINTASPNTLSGQDQLSLTKTIFELINSSSSRRELSFSTRLDWAKLVELQLAQIENLNDLDKSIDAIRLSGAKLLEELKESTIDSNESYSSNSGNWVMTESPIVEFSTQSHLYGDRFAWLNLMLTLTIAYLLYRLGVTKLDEKIREYPRGTAFLLGLGLLVMLPNSIVGYCLILISIVWKISVIIRGVEPVLPNPEL